MAEADSPLDAVHGEEDRAVASRVARQLREPRRRELVILVLDPQTHLTDKTQGVRDETVQLQAASPVEEAHDSRASRVVRVLEPLRRESSHEEWHGDD